MDSKKVARKIASLMVGTIVLKRDERETMLVPRDLMLSRLLALPSRQNMSWVRWARETHLMLASSMKC
ncbi:MAG: hypothetical protein ACTSVI_06855 [Promethearchaeota archaeon]